ncbi:hypothetical protein COT48_05490 [Candidatus Woesearchaeota archaeon CG08_land_8_20_14_0_20_47_9]|nr:MAG: hypothetical protein COV22_00235 [Candidatus Woesearchaeota archaeon CG10_big_fil_rev_8_21_14_0_10_47_5]PIO03289.1 MAG: hypothetical protein COT48_05490 [Candidatus Woesearchaeota archaeon CG08_land_8_20_14_0_20_47_9]HII30255.1 hypothetical protein [Candidatus Woesearchaeota archaeon]
MSRAGWGDLEEIIFGESSERGGYTPAKQRANQDKGDYRGEIMHELNRYDPEGKFTPDFLRFVRRELGIEENEIRDEKGNLTITFFEALDERFRRRKVSFQDRRGRWRTKWTRYYTSYYLSIKHDNEWRRRHQGYHEIGYEPILLLEFFRGPLEKHLGIRQHY